MPLIADRYAKALIDLAISDGSVDEYQNELAVISQIYEAESGLKTFLKSPQRNLTTKKAVLVNVFNDSVRKNILNLLLLLTDKGRIESLPDICKAYVKMADEYRDIINITVTSALPLNKAQIDRIGEKFKTIYNGTSVKIIIKTDESLVGGIKVSVRDKLYDATVKGKLSKMQTALSDSK